MDTFQLPDEPPLKSPDELLNLVWGLCEGSLDDGDVSRLNKLLESSAANREFYRSFVQVVAWLAYEQSTVQSLTPLSAGAPSFFLPEPSNGADVRDYGGRNVLPHDGLPTLAYTKADGFYFRALKHRPAAWLGATVCGTILAVLAIVAVRNSVKPDEPLRASLRPHSGQGQVDTITVKLATTESRTLPIANVGSISIQGPAQLELIGNTRARLHHGRIKVRIEDQRGHGFVVETPYGLVTDLGTEFGVDVDGDSNTGVLVFEGAVDLAVPAEKKNASPRVERLNQGEGLAVHAGRLDRIMSIVTGNVSTFQRRGEMRLGKATAVIVDVWDNIRSTDFKKFYEIVPTGLREDALAYVDRPQHGWNGLDSKGLPPYLIGADYVKPFNSDKMRNDVEIFVSLGKPARLFVLLDDRVSPPEWLRESFRDTGDDIGLDCGAFTLDGVEIWFPNAEGAGNSLDCTFSVWERVIEQPGIVRLGPNSGATIDTGMYAVAAVALE